MTISYLFCTYFSGLLLAAGHACDVARAQGLPTPRQILLKTQVLSCLFTTHIPTETQQHGNRYHKKQSHPTLALVLFLGNLLVSYPTVGHHDTAAARGCAGPGAT